METNRSSITERLSKKVRSVYGILSFFAIIVTITYGYTRDVVTALLVGFLTLVYFILWVLIEDVEKIKRKLKIEGETNE